ncbi:MAG: biotin/lipoyl-containing protein [Candidatus Paceibacterota bacterium]
MKFNFNNQDKAYEVEIIDQNDQVMKVVVNGKEFLYGAEESVAIAAVPQAVLPKRDLSSKEVRAVLAGVITKICVACGDIVKPGEKLLTLSAMKMENEILSECDGKIKEIKVAEDQRVKEGDVLIVLV